MLLDVLSGRTNISTAQLDSICEVLNASDISQGQEDWRTLAPSVQQRLQRLQQLDEQLLLGIRQLHQHQRVTNSCVSSQMDAEKWSLTLDELKQVYESYHVDIRRMLNQN